MQFDEELAESIQQNARRYNMLVADVIESLLPEYKDSEREVPGILTAINQFLLGNTRTDVEEETYKD